MKNYLGLFLVLTIAVYAAYNPFFDGSESSKKTIKNSSPLPFLPPHIAALDPQSVLLGERNTPQSQILYFGFIEADKGKYALIKVNNNNIIVKENNKIYLNNQLYFVRDISSNAVLMETGAKQMKTVYFSGETDGQKP